MKQIKTIVFALTIMAIQIITSCASGLSGEIKHEDRNVKDFTGIELAISGDVYVKQGADYSLTIEADKDILERIETEVDGNTLKIRTQKGYNFIWDNTKINIYVSMPQVERLSISGSGDIKAESSIKTESLALNISGSGDISIPNLSVMNLSARISGSGDIDVSGGGSAKIAEISVSGSGDISLKNIKFAEAEVSIVGSGDAYVNVTEKLNARIVGSGDIRYSGNPLVDAKITGSGELKGK
jgi:hypothetical protein